MPRKSLKIQQPAGEVERHIDSANRVPAVDAAMCCDNGTKEIGHRSLLSRHCIGYDSQSRSRAVDIVLHRGRSAQADRPDNLSVHLDGKPATPRRYTRKRRDACQKRRVALIKLKKS